MAFPFFLQKSFSPSSSASAVSAKQKITQKKQQQMQAGRAKVFITGNRQNLSGNGPKYWSIFICHGTRIGEIGQETF